MLAPELLRDLHVDAHAHPRGQAHLSSASALVIAEGHLCFVADDEHHLGVLALAADPGSAVRLLRIAAGDLPAAAVARKRRKPDLEALVAFPAGVLARRSCLLALGSGSRPGRERGFLVEVGPGMTPGHVRELSLAALYAPLRANFGDLNIEGAFVAADGLHLLQRANAGARRNACIRYDLREFTAWLAGAAAPSPQAVADHDLGCAGDVPFGFTDGAALADGGWVFSAVAEATRDSYADGECAGSLVGRVSPQGELLELQPLAGAPKVEGIAVAGPRRMLLVTDADDPARPSQLLALAWDAVTA